MQKTHSTEKGFSNVIGTILLKQTLRSAYYSKNNRKLSQKNALAAFYQMNIIGFDLRGQPLSTYTKFSEICAYQGVRNVSFSENFAYVLNG